MFLRTMIWFVKFVTKNAYTIFYMDVFTVNIFICWAKLFKNNLTNELLKNSTYLIFPGIFA